MSWRSKTRQGGLGEERDDGDKWVWSVGERGPGMYKWVATSARHCDCSIW